jgi:hypothetical protein
MAIARELHWSLGEVIYGKRVVYENGKGISDFERTLWFTLWTVESEERDEAEAEQKRVQAAAEKAAKPRR